MRIPRTRGAVSGVVLMILGAWAALAPLIGPTFDFSTDSTSAWNFTNDTIWLSILPGAAALIGGFLLLTSANRATAALGAWLGVAAGAWLVAGDQITGLSVSEAGEFEHLAAFEGLGAAIAAVAAFALGRLAVRSVRDEELAREAEIAEHDIDRDGDRIADRPRRTRESGRFDREPAAVAMPATDATTVHGPGGVAPRTDDRRPGTTR
jgi:hypothetical protein